MNYEWSNYCEEKISYFYNISFCFYLFYEESTIALGKKGKKILDAKII